MMKASPESPRMFQNDFLDFFSRSPWWMVPLFWLPVVAFLVSNTQHPKHLILIVVGFCVWSVTEYLLHRFLFHFEFRGEAGQMVHFIIHGVHHRWPNDQYRLVMPLVAAMIIALPFAVSFYWLLGPILFYPFFGGFLLGYVEYECTHYAMHHIKSKNPIFMKLKRHHLLHHHNKACEGTRFGVSSSLWDHVFKTL